MLCMQEPFLLLLWLGCACATSCQPGFYRYGTACVQCPPGTYQPSSGAAGCIECPINQYQPVPQSTSCLACAAGTFTINPVEDPIYGITFASGMTGCESCPQGYMPDGIKGCSPCTTTGTFCNGMGPPAQCAAASAHQYIAKQCTFQSNAVVMQCSVCPAGSFVLHACTPTSDTVCMPCGTCQPFEQYLLAQCSQTANTVCGACNMTAGDLAPGGLCNPCPAGTASADCMQVCPPDTFGQGCQPCPGATEGATRCVKQCDVGLYAPDGQTCVPLESTARSFVIAEDPQNTGQIQAAALTPTPGLFVVALPTQLMVMGSKSAWLFAGSAVGCSWGMDGAGQLACFRSIKGLAWDPDGGGYLVAEEGGYLRWVTAQDAVVSTLVLPSLVGQTWSAIAYAGQPLQFWVGVSGQGILRVDAGGLAQPLWLQVGYQPLMPLALQPASGYVLDNGRVRLAGTIVCGDGLGVLEGRVGAQLACGDVSLGRSGAIDLLATEGGLLLVLLHAATWAGLGSIDGGTVTVLWLLPPQQVPVSLLPGPFVVLRSPSQILQVGLHGCLCDEGLYCEPTTLQCMPPRLGTMTTAAPWMLGPPLPCPAGHFAANSSCQTCHANFTSVGGAWICKPVCGAHLFMGQDGTCVPECGAGLYHDLRLGRCLPCWRGSKGSGGVGVGSCMPCPPGQYGSSDGVCTACPAGTTTAAEGSTRCMPVSFLLCADGGQTCPAQSNTPTLLQYTSSLPSLGVWPDGSLVRSSTLLALCVTCPPSPTFYQAQWGAQTILDEAGAAWAVGLPLPIYGLALMEAQGYVAMLYVSSMLAVEEGTPACAEVYAVSTFDKSVTRLMSQDLLKRPSILMTQCILQPLVLAADTWGTLYVGAGAVLYKAANILKGAAAGLFLNDPYLQVDAGTILYIAPAWQVQGHLFLGTSMGVVHSIPPSAVTTSGFTSLAVQAGGPLQGLGAAGRRAIVLLAQHIIEEILFTNVQGCMAGFIASPLSCMQVGRTETAGCPAGFFWPAAGALTSVPCAPGSVAASVGAPICEACGNGLFSSVDRTQCVSQCARAVGMGCQACPPGYAGSSVCAPCPADTYSAQGGECLPCAAGYTSPPGAHMCVRRCVEGSTCSYDGQTCSSLTKNYQVLSQILLSGSQGTGVVMTLAVDNVGGVFFSDGARIQYYLDNCTSYDTVCSKTGVDLLPAGAGVGYRFSALAICNKQQPSTRCPGGASRSLYAASLITSSIYVLEVCQQQGGKVDVGATAAGSLRLLAGGEWAGFADGFLQSARFNQPVDLELDAACARLFISDFANHRIRLLSLGTGLVTTVAGTGKDCWKVGSTGPCADPQGRGCNPQFADCASLQYPLGIGLSEDESQLYVAANAINALMILDLVRNQLSVSCQFSYRNAVEGTVQQCNLNAANSKGCWLNLPFDAAVFQGEIYVGATQAITRIDQASGLCEQVSGLFFDFAVTVGLRDGMMPMPTPTSSNYSTSLINMPFKMAMSKGLGVLYFADLKNAAVRRVLVSTACVCPPGSLLLPNAGTCYNPSPNSLASAPLPPCPQPSGTYYALQGDVACTRRCSDALSAGLTPAQCLVLPTGPTQTATYEQLLSRLSPPQNMLKADWYGGGPATGWDAIFDSASRYRQGRVPGHATGEPVTVTWEPSQQCWTIETQAYALRPQLILPGLWFACGGSISASTEAGCSCPPTLSAFDQTPLTPADEAAAAQAPKRWQALRDAAWAGQAEGITPNTVVLTLGTPDQSGSATCGASSGPCFPWVSTQPQANNNMAWKGLWGQDRVQSVQCYVGWPAHTYCPNGYRWVLPLQAVVQLCVPTPAVAPSCLSCLPGEYAYAPLLQRQTLGGPYSCQPCEAGFFASTVASTECLPCPANSYAEAQGSSACTACPAGKQTVVPYAYSADQCVECPPGTGNCDHCVPGQYQVLSGQLHCEITPAGFFSPSPQAHAPTPCPAGQFQSLQGRTACKTCPMGSVTLQAQAAVSCTACNTQGNCSLSLQNQCGTGCGLNRYYDFTGGGCVVCPAGTLNAQDPCATDPNVCWESPRRDYYLDADGLVVRCPDGEQAHDDFKSCIPCPKGSYADGTSGGCQPCPAGTYSTDLQSHQCSLCEAGWTSLENRQGCYSCGLGTFAPAPGSPACFPCPPGLIGLGFAASACMVCPDRETVAPAAGMTQCNVTCDTTLGFYAVPGDSQCRYCDGGIVNASDLCQGCGLGHYLHQVDPRECRQCPSGLVNLLQPLNGTCVPCASPTAYALETALGCVEASPGYIPDGTHQIPCPPGTFRNASQTQCTPCPAGYASSVEGAMACAQCGPSTFSAQPQQLSCAQCAAGSIAPGMANTHCEVCVAGTREEQRLECKACPTNTYSRNNGSSACGSCLPPTYSSGGATVCLTCPDYTTFQGGTCGVCQPGSFMQQNGNGQFACIKCSEGTFLSFAGSVSYADCRPCSSGSVALAKGAANCTNCTAGRTASGTSACVGCLGGKYNVDGGLCVGCARGTYGTGLGMTGCLVCQPGTYQNQTMGGTTCTLCPAGKISDGSTGRECLSCALWRNGSKTYFAGSAGQTACIARRTSCGVPFTYVEVTSDPALDNECVPCVLCAQDQLVLAYELGSLDLISPNQSKAYLSQLCPGNTEAPLYRCVSNTPTPGYYLSVTQSVGAAVGAAQVDPYTLQGCQDNSFDASRVEWVAGPDIRSCYVGCKFGISTQGLGVYVTAFQGMPDSTYEENPAGNIFLQRMLPYASKGVCLPCPLSACGRGRFRPNMGGGCGPPCGTSANCSGAPDGCTGVCANLPAHADYVGGSATLGLTQCPWGCLPGWHLADNRSACLPCGLPALQLCNSSSYALSSECLPWHTSQDMCRYCAPQPSATLAGWNVTCLYKCYPGYYNGGNDTCVLCTLPAAPCPVGFFWDEATCMQTGAPPQCRPCDHVDGLSFVSDGGLNASQCRASCPPGFHTLSKRSGAYADYALPGSFPTVHDALCVQCLPTDTRSCNFTTPCFQGYFRNVSVRDGQSGSCAPCRTSASCQAGFYAPVCTGANLTDAPCVACDAALLVNQRFVPYGLQRGRVTKGDCPRACLNNFVQAQDSPLQCAPCPRTLPCATDGFQPPLCAFRYAHWNATPGLQWWDADHAPPFIPFSTAPVERAGVCWACPVGTATLVDSTDLCITLPGYSSAGVALPASKLQIPSLPSDIYLVMQAPKMPLLIKPKRRRLLTVQATAPTTGTDLAVRPCPFGSYKTKAGDSVCNVCPEGASTASEASVSLDSCVCRLGYRLVQTQQGPCDPCPQDTFSNVSVGVVSTPSACTPCPPNMSTLGTVGATRCACALGFVGLGPEGACVPCAEGYYCPPCTTADAQCRAADQRPCFAGSTSPAGSYGITNCSCVGEGQVLASRPKDSTQLYCQPLPLGARVDPLTGRIGCQPGWSSLPQGGCMLCPPGQYAIVDEQGQLLLTLGSNSKPFCLPCPLNTYNPSIAAIGGCTPCPPQQVTLQTGATSLLDNCSCPLGLLPVKAGCVGCLPNQFAPPGGHCQACPLNSLAQPGATSLKDCMCLPGFTLQQGAECEPCPKGAYSTHSSNAPCAPCPKGSTTSGAGASRVTACGESADLCLPGYSWRLGAGCFLNAH